MINQFKTYRLYFAWIIAVIALFGSLFLSEVMRFEPCKLCWFQRICMYPLAPLLGLAAYRNDQAIVPYARILSVIGMGFSLFHYLEQKVPSMSTILPCTVGIPCNGQYMNWLGFITIPFMALIAFSLITVLLFLKESTQK
ncbi:disulfide oxidoreductase [Paenibacillus cremeus]|uniref:Disulfide bond formation protein B n=1 Tax=Paenibacillus cremeus TaxID=2163881 RepID=A0A559JE89_9BACL|nr:disulfide oxidoreductase [Paenibacillus cremeus]TVX98201.1 disulfide bond formation protein B [Paenibacillus cremeus]